MAGAKVSKRRQESGDETAVRKRILEAAFTAFMKSGYAAASTLEIATHARVSKRELYALEWGGAPALGGQKSIPTAPSTSSNY